MIRVQLESALAENRQLRFTLQQLGALPGTAPTAPAPVTMALPPHAMVQQQQAPQQPLFAVDPSIMFLLSSMEGGGGQPALPLGPQVVVGQAQQQLPQGQNLNSVTLARAPAPRGDNMASMTEVNVAQLLVNSLPNDSCSSVSSTNQDMRSNASS